MRYCMQLHTVVFTLIVVTQEEVRDISINLTISQNLSEFIHKLNYCYDIETFGNFLVE